MVAVITGASGGLGRELAGQLAAKGWDLLLTARRAGHLEALAAALRAALRAAPFRASCCIF